MRAEPDQPCKPCKPRTPPPLRPAAGDGPCLDLTLDREALTAGVRSDAAALRQLLREIARQVHGTHQTEVARQRAMAAFEAACRPALGLLADLAGLAGQADLVAWVRSKGKRTR